MEGHSVWWSTINFDRIRRDVLNRAIIFSFVITVFGIPFDEEGEENTLANSRLISELSARMFDWLADVVRNKSWNESRTFVAVFVVVDEWEGESSLRKKSFPIRRCSLKLDVLKFNRFPVLFSSDGINFEDHGNCAGSWPVGTAGNGLNFDTFFSV